MLLIQIPCTTESSMRSSTDGTGYRETASRTACAYLLNVTLMTVAAIYGYHDMSEEANEGTTMAAVPKAETVRVGRKVIIGMLGLGAAGLALGPYINPLSWLSDLGANFDGPGSNLGFRIYTVNGIPKFDPTSWRFTMDGMVGKPLNLSFDDIRALPQIDQTSDFHCVTGWSVKNVAWSGVRLNSLFDLAGASASATSLNFYSSDGVYVDSLSAQQSASPTVLLAHSLNGEPLSAEQGAPLRLVIPEMYGYKGVKWVNRIELKARQDSGYWEQRGYPANAFITR